VLSDRTTLKDTNPSIIIGTPGNIYIHHKLLMLTFPSGRILALADDRTLKLNRCTQLVVDECDDLLTNNLSTVEKIFAHLPDNKQVLMTSSTINSEVEQVPPTPILLPNCPIPPCIDFVNSSLPTKTTVLQTILRESHSGVEDER